MDRAVQYAGADRYIWRQFGLALACTGRFPRAIKVIIKKLKNYNAAFLGFGTWNCFGTTQ